MKKKKFSWGNKHFLGSLLIIVGPADSHVKTEIILHILDLPLRGSVPFLCILEHQNKNYFFGHSSIHVCYVLWMVLSYSI